MAYRPTKRRHHPPGEELNLTPIMNVFMIIIPFLLLTAVFAKTAIIDIFLPQERQSELTGSASPILNILTIKTTEKGFELGGIGEGVFVPKNGNDLNFKQLTKELIKLKTRYPEQKEVVLLFAPHAPYDLIVKVMDTARETQEEKVQVLFPLVSLGEN